MQIFKTSLRVSALKKINLKLTIIQLASNIKSQKKIPQMAAQEAVVSEISGIVILYSL